jgi:lysophospholipase L1-like esterase
MPRFPRALTLFTLLLFTLPASADDAPAKSATPPATPTLFLIGDSTVKNGSGKGADGQWGWGDCLAEHFDKSRLTIANRALGGRSSRTYFTEGLWDKTLAALKPGDVVLIQFGHNDGGALTGPRATGRASIKGTGDETQDVTNDKTGKTETVHTYGWYLRKYITDAKSKGATPIVLSPIPRNMWKDGKVLRANNDYGKWAAEAARSENVPFIDLNDLVATRYESLGEDKVKPFFPKDHTHTDKQGAALNAAIVAEAIKSLKNSPLSALIQ